MNITFNLQDLMTPLVALLCPGEYKLIFIPAEAPVADFSGPAEGFLYLIIAYVIHFVSQLTNVETLTKTFPMKEAKELHVNTTPPMSGTLRPEPEELTSRTGFAFHCHCKKYLLFRELLSEDEKAIPKFLKTFKPREFSLREGTVNS